MAKKIIFAICFAPVAAALLFAGCTALRAFRRTTAAVATRSRIVGAVEPPETAEIANRRFFPDGAPDGGRLVQSLAAEPAHFNYIINNEATAAELAMLCNATLAERDWENVGVFKPMLAEKWEISPDHLSFRITLRKNVFYNDFRDPDTGEEIRKPEVTAHDFKFFVDVVKDEKVNAAPLRVYYQDLERIEVEDDHHFTVVWKRPFAGALQSTLEMAPLPKIFYWNKTAPFDGARFNSDHRRNKEIVGCGPYRLSEWKKDKYIRFVRNENYFGTRYGIAPKLDVLEFRIIKHPNTRFQALQAKQLDRLALTPDQWLRRGDSRIFRDGSFRKYRYLVPQYTYIGYNQKNPLFRDKRVRRALTMLVDRERIRREIYFGLAENADGPFFAQSAYADPGLKPLPFDPERAKALLAQAQWRDEDGDGILEKDGEKFSFTMLQAANSSIQQRMLPLIRESFAAAGIDMQLQTVEWSVYVQKLEKRDFDACSLGWTTSFDPDLYQIWHSSQASGTGSNHVAYRNEEVDRLIEKMRVTFDEKERVVLARRIGEIIYDDQPYTFLFTPYSLAAISEKYDNVRVFPVGIPDAIFFER
ncbi:MAG: peptide-binding protein [Victivallaceae bacterium]|nr:peptide-binding protein [Victivallaceae bacterium]